MKTKQLTIRIPMDFHQQLVKYSEEHYLPVSRVITQAVAKAIAYKPQRATSRSTASPSPVTAVEPEYGDVNPEDFLSSVDESDWDVADLQRRAAAAPLKGV